MDIVKEIGEVIDAMKNPVADKTKPPFYFYGHPVQVNRELLALNRNNPKGDTKYPAFIFRLDTPATPENGYWKFNINIAVVGFSNRTRRTEERIAFIQSDLWPLWSKFVELLPLYGFQWTGDLRIPPGTVVERPYHGTKTEDRNTDNAFNDPLDALEVINLKISKQPTC